MPQTTIPASHHDLLDTDVAVLATVNPDGHPQLSAIWFLATPDQIRISLDTERQKTRNLRRDPAVTFFILDRANPMRYLEVRGTATVEDDDDWSFADQVGAKYGADLRTFGPPDAKRVVVTVHPTHVVAADLGG